MKINIGQIKVLADRQRGYYTWLNTLMLAYLFFKNVGFRWYYPVILICLLVVSVVVDVKFIMPNELKYMWRKNPMAMEVTREIKNRSDNN